MQQPNSNITPKYCSKTHYSYVKNSGFGAPDCFFLCSPLLCYRFVTTTLTAQIPTETLSQSHRLCFIGKERDSETGYSYFGARYYDSDLMTGWLSVDPLADKYPGLSPYAYCANNPIRLVDPNGEELALNDDIVIKGANNSSITLKTDAVDFTINTNTDFGGNHEIEDLKNVAIGYEVGVNGTGAAGVGFSFSPNIQISSPSGSTNFTGFQAQ